MFTTLQLVPLCLGDGMMLVMSDKSITTTFVDRVGTYGTQTASNLVAILLCGWGKARCKIEHIWGCSARLAAA